jgi:hypothetical protein
MNRFKTVLATGIILGAAILPCLSQSKPAVNMNQYLFPEFTECIIKSKVGTITKEVGNYNTITGKIAFIKDNSIYGITTVKQSDTIILNDRYFVPFGENFYEVLLNAPISLFIQHQSRLIAPGQEVGYGSTSKLSNVDTYSHITTQSGVYSLEIPPDFEIRYLPVFWIRKDGNMYSFIGKKQFLKIFPEKKKELGAFMKTGNIKLEEPADVKKLVEYCNELYAR